MFGLFGKKKKAEPQAATKIIDLQENVNRVSSLVIYKYRLAITWIILN